MPTRYLGNMVISMQAIHAILSDKHFDSITLLVDESFEALARLVFGQACDYIVYPRGALARGNVVARLTTYSRFIRELRSVYYQCALDIDGSVVSGRVTSFARAHRKVGPGFAKRPRAYGTLVPVMREEHHCFHDFVLMARSINVPVSSDNYLEIPRIEGAKHPVDALIRQPKIACIHPCATKDYKQWDIRKFASLADELAHRGWCVIIVGAGASEMSRIETLLGAMETSPVNAHGALNLLELVYLLQRSDVFIGNDSGPMHLAAATGIPVIALFGPTELKRWRPKAKDVHILKGPLPCAPGCQTEACLADYQCLTSLTVEQVVSETNRLSP